MSHEMNPLQLFEKTSPEQLLKLPTTIEGGPVLNNPRAMAHIGNVARIFAYSDLVPDHYRKKPHEIFIALVSASNLKVDAMTFLQGTTVIHGRQGMFASLINSLLTRSGKLIGAVRYEIDRPKGEKVNGIDNVCIRAWAIEKETNEKLFGPRVDLNMAKAEGWFSNKKYTSMPEIMLEKRALTFFARRYFPEVLNGMHETGEIEDMAASGQLNQAKEPIPEFNLDESTSPQGELSGKPEGHKEGEKIEPPKQGSKPWYQLQLKEMGVTFKTSDNVGVLKKLYLEAMKRKKQAEDAEEAEIEKPEETTDSPNIAQSNQKQLGDNSEESILEGEEVEEEQPGPQEEEDFEDDDEPEMDISDEDFDVEDIFGD